MSSKKIDSIFRLEYILFIVLNLFFFGDILSPQNFTRYIYMFLGCIYILYILRNIKRILRLERYFMLLFRYILILLFYGIYNNNFNSYIYVDILCFSSFLLILISFRSRNRIEFFIKTFPKLGVIINVFAISSVVLYVLFYGFTMASVETGRNLVNDEGGVVSPKYLLYGSLLLYPLIGYLKTRKERFIYNISIFLFIFFSLAMSSRGTTFIGLLVYVLTYLHNKKLNINLKLIFNFKVIGYAALFILLLIIIYQIDTIGSAVDFLFYRFTSGESIGEARTEEATEIYNNLTFKELFIGRGFGAANTYWIFSNVTNGVNNVHYGWMYLILKGGVFLLVFIYGKILHSIIKLNKNKLLVPYSIILISFLLLEYAHTNFNSFYKLSFMFIALSATSVLKKTQNER